MTNLLRCQLQSQCQLHQSQSAFRALRWAMRSHWDLPPEHCFYKTGPEWLHQLMVNCEDIQRGRILMILWRSWHLRCDITHGRGEETIARSVAFLLSYDKDLQNLHANNNKSNTGFFLLPLEMLFLTRMMFTGLKMQIRIYGNLLQKET
jgi:hypothetical protein